MMRCTIPINKRREPVYSSACRHGAARRRSRRPGSIMETRPRAVSVIQRPVTPNHIVMQRLHRAEGGRALALASGALQRHERLARPLCVRVLRRKPMYYLTQWDTDTPFAVSPAA